MANHINYITIKYNTSLTERMANYINYIKIKYKTSLTEWMTNCINYIKINYKHPQLNEWLIASTISWLKHNTSYHLLMLVTTRATNTPPSIQWSQWHIKHITHKHLNEDFLLIRIPHDNHTQDNKPRLYLTCPEVWKLGMGGKIKTYSPLSLPFFPGPIYSLDRHPLDGLGFSFFRNLFRAGLLWICHRCSLSRIVHRGSFHPTQFMRRFRNLAKKN